MKAKVRRPTPTIFDFQHIPYIYAGKTPANGLDCFTLYNYIRYKYEKRMVTGFEEFYKYEAHRDMPVEYLRDIAIETFGEPNGHIKETKLPFLLNDWGGVFGFSTTLEYLGKHYMVTTSQKKGSMAFPLSKYQGRVIHAWDLETCEKKRLEKVDNFYGQNIC